MNLTATAQVRLGAGEETELSDRTDSWPPAGRRGFEYGASRCVARSGPHLDRVYDARVARSEVVVEIRQGTPRRVGIDRHAMNRQLNGVLRFHSGRTGWVAASRRGVASTCRSSAARGAHMPDKRSVRLTEQGSR